MNGTTSLRSTVRVQAGLIERLRENITDLKGKLKKATQDKEILQRFFRDEILNSEKLKKHSCFTRDPESFGPEGRTPRFPRRASAPDITLTSFDMSFNSTVSTLGTNEQLTLLVHRFGSIQDKLIHFNMKAPVSKYEKILSTLQAEKQFIENELYKLSKSLN